MRDPISDPWDQLLSAATALVDEIRRMVDAWPARQARPLRDAWLALLLPAEAAVARCREVAAPGDALAMLREVQDFLAQTVPEADGGTIALDMRLAALGGVYIASRVRQALERSIPAEEEAL